ncbi:NAD-dependent epimerase/dehydratase family protein [Tenacibaculum finnmarkense genomovar ulcerans]|uniref:NAD-dependent epimerase/dehydratase family protein n=1 Tax=Tenacibaculum finnmarkense TaxID=2781243 RepID=UPI00187B49A3|nr:NAD-dependent epimerase/dehydratase family protein [Tenacibaculum finnmarkense]MBE7688653.1 NAD-dependent epimerase/dehydratase family protein [Tenacibaculum finnmarkense genomovar ulcerans]
MKTRVLVTCVGSGVGQSVVDSLNLKRNYKIVGCDGNRNVYAHSFCDKFYKVRSLYADGYIQELIAICIENDIDIVIPGHDHELSLFSENIEKFIEKGIIVLVSEPSVTKISRDKQEWYNFFAPKGCKIVPTISVKEFNLNVDTSIFPAIVKPSGGSASQGISIINTVGDLKGLKEEDIIQPYLFPEKEDPNYEAIEKAVKKGDFIQKSEISIQLLFNKNSEHKGIFISKNTLKNGVPIFVDPINPETFKYLDEILKFVPILEDRKVKGPVNIQGRITPEGLFFFEMNMRFTGITGNRALLGFNEVDYLVRNFLDKPTVIDGYAINKLGVRQVACATIPKIKNKADKKIATILGAGSSIGQHFINSLNLKEYSKIYLITRSESIKKYNYLFQDPIFDVVSDTDNKLTTCFTQSDVLVNFVSALAFQEDKLKYYAIRYIYKMIPKIAKSKIPKIINISSQSVYDQKENISKTEESDTVANTSYAFQKIIIEDFFASINEHSVLTKIINLRFPRVLNTTNLKQLGFFGTIVSNYMSGVETQIGNPNNNTNLIDIDDVCNAINYTIETVLENSILNVGGQDLSMKEYCEEVKSQLPQNKNSIIYGEDKSVKSSSMINAAKISSLGWKPKKTVKDIITAIIKNKTN